MRNKKRPSQKKKKILEKVLRDGENYFIYFLMLQENSPWRSG